MRQYGGPGAHTCESIHRECFQAVQRLPDERWPDSFLDPLKKAPIEMSEFDHILVAIRDRRAKPQRHGAFCRDAARAFFRVDLDGFAAALPQPFGVVLHDVRGAVKVAPLDSFDDPKHSLGGLASTEVFWADIPQEVVEEGRTLEESKAWARTVAARARAICKNKIGRKSYPGKLSEIIEPDFSLAAEVLEEVIETVYVLENLTFLAEKAGMMKFDLRRCSKNISATSRS